MWKPSLTLVHILLKVEKKNVLGYTSMRIHDLRSIKLTNEFDYIETYSETLVYSSIYFPVRFFFSMLFNIIRYNMTNAD